MKTQLDLSSRVVRSPEPISAETGGGVVMLSIEAGKYFGLNETAQAIWARMEAPITVAALVQSIQAAFDVDAGRAEAAVLAFVAQLIEENIATLQG
jgi:Coenzyme PQQ synthesis protein D (PqqD)